MTGVDSVEWLIMMADHSRLTDCIPHFCSIAEEIKLLRREVSDLRGINAVLERTLNHVAPIDPDKPFG